MSERVIDLTSPSPVKVPSKRPMSVSELVGNEPLPAPINLNQQAKEASSWFKENPAEKIDVDQLVNEALDSADVTVLRSILRTLYAKSEEFKLKIQNELLVSATAEIARGEPPSKKRRTSNGQDMVFTGQRYKFCRQCNQQFDVTQNYDDSCWRHSGEVEMNEDAFPDDDDIRQNGGMDDVENDWRFHEWPENFTWSCCEGIGDAEACRVGPHNDKTVGEGRSVESELDSEEERENCDEGDEGWSVQ